jgi:hypothetical protein
MVRDFQLRWRERPHVVGRSGLPWEKTTKRLVAFRISCSAALAKNNYVRLSSQKVAMQFSGSTNIYRKSGFGLRPLRNFFKPASRDRPGPASRRSGER